jgi:hypothetical protein
MGVSMSRSQTSFNFNWSIRHVLALTMFPFLLCPDAARADFTVTFGGDVNFNKNKQAGHTVAFAAIGITDESFSTTSSWTGILSYRNNFDYDLVLKSLRAANADLKILSVHSGVEMKTTTEKDPRVRLERALQEGDVDLVLGHHPHVVRPVSFIDGRAIFYSLGNYLMLGAADIGGKGLGLDDGLFARANYGWDASRKRLRLQATEVIPLANMHLLPKPLGVRAAAERVSYLNRLSASDLGVAKGMQFRVRSDGSGVACVAQNKPSIPLSARASAVCQ